jgi:hypothetical protein
MQKQDSESARILCHTCNGAHSSAPKHVSTQTDLPSGAKCSKTQQQQQQQQQQQRQEWSESKDKISSGTSKATSATREECSSSAKFNHP